MSLELVSLFTLSLLWIILMIGAVGFLFHILRMDRSRQVRAPVRIKVREK
jgi:flagellar biogenesis protein FliO